MSDTITRSVSVVPAPIRRHITTSQLLAMLALSKAGLEEVRRRDPSFPKSYRYTPRGRHMWDVAEIEAWLDKRREAPNGAA
ncbi:MAG TPA: hypothetical protein VH682_24565 [Gemmataceae bacterium]|jgi:prophage regulatory protein